MLDVRSIRVRDIVLFLFLGLFFAPAAGIVTAGQADYVVNAPMFASSLVQFVEATVVYKGRNLIAALFIIYLLVTRIYEGLPLIHGVAERAVAAYAIASMFLVASTVCNSGDARSVCIMTVCNIGLLLVVIFEIRNDAQRFFKIFQIALLADLSISLLTVIAFPSGITTGSDALATPYHIYGSKNQTTPLLILSCLVFFVHYSFSKRKCLLAAGGVLVLLNALFMGSSTGVLGIVFLLGAYSVFMLSKRHSRDGRPSVVSCIRWQQALVAFILFVYVGVTLFNFLEGFGWLTAEIMGKDITLSGRTEIWADALLQIAEKPVFGYGYGHFVVGHFYAHNGLLELILESGVIGALFYGGFLVGVFSSGMFKGATDLDVTLAFSVSTIFVVNISEAFLWDISILGCYIIVACRSLIIANLNSTDERRLHG